MINLEEAEKFDNLKTKVLKYILYKKRTVFNIHNSFLLLITYDLRRHH